VQVDNPERALRAGMFAEARLTLAQKEGVLSIPQAAVRQEGDASFVFAIEDGRLVQKPVTLGMRGIGDDGPAVEVTAGLAEGAQIVRTNLGRLKTGSVVRIVTGPHVQAAAR